MVAERQKVLGTRDRARVYAAAEKVGRMLSGLRNVMLRRLGEAKMVDGC